MGKFNDLFNMYNYVVNEGEDGNLTAFPTSLFLGIVYIAMFFIFTAIMYFYFEDNPDSIEDITIFLLFIIVFARYGFKMVKLELRLRKAKNLKRNGMGIVKRLKVSEITKAKVYKSKGKSFDVICVKASDGATAYYSTGHLKGKILGTSKSDLKKIYSEHGFVYDENESQKKDLLSQLDGEISKAEYEIENSGFFKKIRLGKDLQNMINERQTIEAGHIPQFWEVNGNKISVGDTVDVYIDPNNPEIYWVDIDFLFDK